MSRYRDEYYISRDRRGAPEVDVSVSESSSRSRTPAFIKREEPRDMDMVLRSRKVEQGYSRRRSPSPVRYEERRPARVERSPSPVMRGARSRSRPPVEQRVRLVDRARSVSPDNGRVRIVGRERSIEAERCRTRIDIEETCNHKERSPSPPPPPKTIQGPLIERDVVTHWTDVDHRKRECTPSPPPMPKKIQGPTIEREVVTHWRDVDHGMIRACSPTPPPPPRRVQHETDIDIDIDHRHGRHGRHHTDVDVDIHHSHSRSAGRHRSQSRGPIRHRSMERRAPPHYHDDTEVDVRIDHDRYRFESDGRHRSHSAAPLRSPSPSYSEEADYITSRIDSRGRMGEAYSGHTKDWTIVDVPPGTEKVRMNGVGGGSAEVEWSRYSGVRRSKFIAERGEVEPTPRSSGSALVVADSAERERDHNVSVQIYDKHSHGREERVKSDMWTEITKDLVCKEAIERMGYEYEETEWFYYIMEYLKYEDVLEIVNMSDRIRDSRRRRARDIEYERDHSHHIDISANHSHSHGRPEYRDTRDRRRDPYHANDRDLYIDRRAFQF
ncbi:hypothetical protein MKZ38_009273 [Zalerion maritima]|uniref:DUF8035 domain-containing protein n=1 Tax=Zalerion maritima TaxID=339359 RepID=A0AAD5WMC6_9PEZI|nr:hypothetical protein MKZ38_009273 [Zalerion maritima]